MTEQWQELKETITELRDNDGTGTQQEVCKFLANLMDVLEKQMQEPKTEKVIKMRDATTEERESVDKYVKSISKPTGVNFWEEQEPCDEFDIWIKNRLTKNDIYNAIFEGMTNGEVIMAMFPNVNVYEHNGGATYSVNNEYNFNATWWNAPYQKGANE